MIVIDEAKQPSGIEEEEASDAGVTMELAYGLGEHRAAELSLLDQSLCFGETASVARGTAIKGDCVNHTVAIEEVMPSDRLEQWVGAVSQINSINAIRDGAGDRKRVTDRLLRHGSEVSGNLNTGVGGFRKRVLALM